MNYILKHITIKHLQDVRELIDTDETFPFLKNRNDSFFIHLFNETKNNIENDAEAQVLFGLFDTSNNQENLIGFVGHLKTTNVLKMMLGGLDFHIIYKIKKDYRNRGLTTNCVKTLINWLTENKKINYTAALVEKTNLSSIRILEKCQFDLKFENLSSKIYFKRICMPITAYQALRYY